MDNARVINSSSGYFNFSPNVRKGILIGGGVVTVLAVGAGIVGILIGRNVIPGTLSLSTRAIIGIGSGLAGLGVLSAAASVFVFMKPARRDGPIRQNEAETEQISATPKQDEEIIDNPEIDARFDPRAIALWRESTHLKFDENSAWKKLTKQEAQSVEFLDSTIDAARENWIEEGQNLHFSWCKCGTHNSVKRYAEEKFILSNIMKKFPDKGRQLSIMSLGSGTLLQDWVILKELVSLGYSNIKIKFVDPNLSEGLVDIFRKAFEKLQVNIEISSADLTHNVKSENFDVVYAIDFLLLECDSENIKVGFEALAACQDMLNPTGFIFASKDGKYYYDAEIRKWEHNVYCSLESVLPTAGEDKKFVISMQDFVDRNFQQLWVIQDLVKKGYKVIDIHTKLASFFPQYRRSLTVLMKKLFNLKDDVIINFKDPLVNFDEANLIIRSKPRREIVQAAVTSSKHPLVLSMVEDEYRCLNFVP